VSTGAADDLDRATGIALDMTTRYGMAATLGQRTYAPAPETFLTPTAPRAFAASEVTAREIDVATREIIARADARAREILMRRRAELDAGVTLLLARETLNAEDFEPLRRPAKPADAPALSPP
jgi:cell division protease FtsH